MKNKIKSQFALKRGTYNTALIAIVLAVIVALNVLATMLCQRYPLQIDLTATGQNTLTEDNAEFLQQVDREINIVLCATEKDYVSQMANYAYNLYQVYSDQTAQNYYRQTQTLLRQYEKQNDKISFRYVSPDSANFVSVSSVVPDTNLAYGDILVYSKFTDETGERTNTKVLTFTDLYNLSNDSMAYGGGYSVVGSNLESAVTGAVSSVLIDDVKNIAYLSGHSTADMFDYLEATLGNNGFKINDIADKVIGEIPKDTDIVAIVGPESDLTADELKLLDEFLDNGGKKGKNLFVYMNALSAENKTPNLDEFLKEWGVECEIGNVLYETEAENCVFSGGVSYYTAPYVYNAGSDFTADVNSSNGMYISMYNVPMKTAYTQFGNRSTTVIMNTSDTAVSVPWDAEIGDTQKPGKEYKTDSYAAAIMTTETVYGDGDAAASNVCVFSSANFVSGSWDVYYGCNNLALSTALYKNVTGQETADVYFVPKGVPTYQFVEAATKGETQTVLWIFMLIMPVAVLAAGIVVWWRRRSR